MRNRQVDQIACRRRQDASPGESEVGEGPLRKGLDAALASVSTRWDPPPWILSALHATSLAITAPLALWAWLCTGVSIVLVRALEALFSGVAAATGDEVAPVLLTSIALVIGLRALFLPVLVISTRRAAKINLMQPHLRAHHAKFRGRRDDASRQQMTEEFQALYKRAGVSIFSPGILAVPIVVIALGGFWGLLEALTIRNTMGTFSPQYVDPSGDLARYLGGRRDLSFLGLSLTTSVVELGLCWQVARYYVVLGTVVLVQLALCAPLFKKHRMGALYVFALAILGLSTLPTFFLFIRLADGLYLLAQGRLLKGVYRGRVIHLRRDPDFRLSLGDLAAGFIPPRPLRPPHNPNQRPPQPGSTDWPS